MPSTKQQTSNGALNLESSKALMIKLRELEQRQRSGSFSGLYGKDTSSMSLNELMEQMTITKEKERKLKEEKRGPPKWKPPPILFETKVEVHVPNKPSNIPTNPKVDCTIARFRPKEKKMVTSHYPTPELVKTLYRDHTIGGDTSGRRIFNLGRDLKRGGIPWRPGAFDKDINPIGFEQSHPWFRKMLLGQLETAVAKAESDLKAMKPTTDKERNAKARLGAELHVLITKRDALIAAIKASEPKNQLDDSCSIQDGHGN